MFRGCHIHLVGVLRNLLSDSVSIVEHSINRIEIE